MSELIVSFPVYQYHLVLVDQMVPGKTVRRIPGYRRVSLPLFLRNPVGDRKMLRPGSIGNLYIVSILHLTETGFLSPFFQIDVTIAFNRVSPSTG